MARQCTIWDVDREPHVTGHMWSRWLQTFSDPALDRTYLSEQQLQPRTESLAGKCPRDKDIRLSPKFFLFSAVPHWIISLLSLGIARLIFLGHFHGT